MESVQFRNVKINNYNFEEIQRKIYNSINQKGYVCLIEVSGIIRSQKDPELFKALNNSTISIPDGAPVVWFGKLVGCHGIEHIPGYSLMSRMIEGENKHKHFLLGDTDETISKVIEKARHINPSIEIEGYSPPFKDKFSDMDNDLMIRKINEAQADVIWVSFGMGKQEKWMLENHGRINKGVMIGVGAAFKFYIGKIKAPNSFIQRAGLTWHMRMKENPREFLRRQFPERLRFISFFSAEVIKGSRNKAINPSHEIIKM